jgi:transposase
MLGPPKLRLLDQPVTVSLEDLVPAGNFYRYLDAPLDLSFVRTWVADSYADQGRPSIDPVVFFKLQLILFFEGLRSERKLMETVALNLAHRWYLGYHLDEPLPDHSSLTRIRERLGLRTFARFFDHIVDLCQEAGLVWGKELFFDGTKVRANAGVDSLVPRWSVAAKAHLDDIFANAATAASADEPSDSAPDPDAPDRLPFVGTTQAEQALAAANTATWKLLDEHRLDPERPPGRGGYHRKSDLQVSTTDPDATLLRPPDSGRLGYHDHYVVDGGKARVILATLVTPADVMENTPMLDLLNRVRFRWKLRPAVAVGDTTYGTIENIRALESTGIRAYVPVRVFEEKTPYYPPTRFTYHPAFDVYQCPQGELLVRDCAISATEVVRYQADAATCNTCPVKAACTSSTTGRQIHRSFYADELARVRAYHETEAYQKAMRKRAVWVEPLFGEAKQWHGLRKFRLRGL